MFAILHGKAEIVYLIIKSVKNVIKYLLPVSHPQVYVIEVPVCQSHKIVTKLRVSDILCDYQIQVEILLQAPNRVRQKWQEPGYSPSRWA